MQVEGSWSRKKELIRSSQGLPPPSETGRKLLWAILDEHLKDTGENGIVHPPLGEGVAGAGCAKCKRVTFHTPTARNELMRHAS